MSRYCPAEMAAELLKTLRTRWMCKQDIADWAGWDHGTASRWVNRWVEHGLLEQRREIGKHRRVKVYRLAPAWVGPDHVETT